MQKNLVMTTLYIHSNTNTSYFLAAAPLGKLTGLVLKNPVNNSSKHNLVKRVFFLSAEGLYLDFYKVI